MVLVTAYTEYALAAAWPCLQTTCIMNNMHNGLEGAPNLLATDMWPAAQSRWMPIKSLGVGSSPHRAQQDHRAEAYLLCRTAHPYIATPQQAAVPWNPHS